MEFLSDEVVSCFPNSLSSLDSSLDSSFAWVLVQLTFCSFSFLMVISPHMLVFIFSLVLNWSSALEKLPFGNGNFRSLGGKKNPREWWRVCLGCLKKKQEKKDGYCCPKKTKNKKEKKLKSEVSQKPQKKKKKKKKTTKSIETNWAMTNRRRL